MIIIENSSRSPVILSAPKDERGEAVGKAVVIPAGVRTANRIAPGRLELASKVEAKPVLDRLGDLSRHRDLRVIGA